MTITTTAESRIYVSPKAMAALIADESDITAVLAEFAAITDWVEVNEAEDLGEFGDEASEVTFTAIKNGRVRKLKGSKDAGTIALVCGRDPLDAGQKALVKCEGTKFQYPFKIVASDAPDETITDTEFYFLGLVMSKRNNYGTVDNVVRTTFNVAVNSALFEKEMKPV
ncbi:iron ABC transporter substrate-binding protein [Pseudochrobactrum sp. MP213Fo]|uniref:iron ABC transporter substrate-binding protein n=1 Tax=Pseudochrobactrum sp. MP213Fo TaxID=3022250 RepID=UPI003BA3D1FE